VECAGQVEKRLLSLSPHFLNEQQTLDTPTMPLNSKVLGACRVIARDECVRVLVLVPGQICSPPHKLTLAHPNRAHAVGPGSSETDRDALPLAPVGLVGCKGEGILCIPYF
jgi:hypothetical protein